MRLKQFRLKLFRFRFSEEFRFRIPIAISTGETAIKLEKEICFALRR
jgi:hypothetical protein